MKTVCIDFDGVMNTYDGWKGDDELFQPREGLEDFLMKLSQHFKLVVLSTRNAKKIWEWLFDHHLEIYIEDVTNEKVPAIAYLDDRGVCFTGDFSAALEALLNFKTHWETNRG